MLDYILLWLSKFLVEIGIAVTLFVCLVIWCLLKTSGDSDEDAGYK